MVQHREQDVCEPGARQQQHQFLSAQCAGLVVLWRSQQLLDVHIRAADGGTHGAHRVVLASSSGFFRALLCGAGQSMKEGCSSRPRDLQDTSIVVQLPYSSQQLSSLLTILYEHSIEVDASNVAWLLDMASYLEVQPLQEACCEFLRSTLSPEACVDVLLLAHHYQCTSLQSEGVQYIARRLSSLLLLPEVRQALTKLPAALLSQLLSSEALEVDQETELLCLASDWVATAPQDRLPLLHGLLPLLQLSLLPAEAPWSQQQFGACTTPAAAQLARQLHQAAVQCRHQQDVQQQQGIQGPQGSPSNENGVCWQSLQQQHSQQQLPPSQAVNILASCSGATAAAGAACGLHISGLHSAASVDPNNHTSSSSSATVGEQCTSSWLDCIRSNSSSRCIGSVVLDAWPGRQRSYQPTRLLVAGGHELSWRALKAVELYDPRSDCWSPGPSLPAALPFAGAALLGRGGLYVVGGGMASSLLVRLDAAGGCWHSCEGPRTPRVHAAVAGASGLLYVAGGRSQVNQVVATTEVYNPSSCCWQSLPDMQQPRYAHAVAALAGRVYAVGGQASKAIHRSVEVFDAGRGAWELLPQQLASERKYCAAAALGGRLLVLGGMSEARARLASLEGFDPREGRWTLLTSMTHARSSCGVSALGGRLFAVGGNAGDQQLHASVEVFDPAAGRWMSCAPLSCGRSGLLAAAV